MNNFMLLASTGEMTFGEKLSFGGSTVLLGMGSVFAVLGIIFAVLMIFKYVFTNLEAKKKPAKEEPVAVITPAPVYTDDSEIIAVIAAAIAMAESESEDNIKFRVVSFRRK